MHRNSEQTPTSAGDPRVATLVSWLPESAVETWEERAAIRQFDAGYTKRDAEIDALLDVLVSRGPPARVFRLDSPNGSQWLLCCDAQRVADLGRELQAEASRTVLLNDEALALLASLASKGTSSGSDTEVASFSDTLDTNIENLILSGTAALSGTGNAANNVMTGNTAANALSGGLGDDKLNGGDGDDSLTGGDGADSLSGGNGNDRLYAGTGTDTLTGGVGNDVYYVDSSTDVIVEGTSSGSDTEVASFSDTLDTNIENLILSGTAALSGTGNAANNVMTGNTAANALSGGLGDDLLRGGAGNDILTGGGGLDIFRFDTALSTTPNIDKINDFAASDDTIQLENSIFVKLGTSTGAIDSTTFVKNTTGAAADGNDYIIYKTDSGKLFYDADGSGTGASVQIALLGTNLALTNADFVLV